MKEYEIVVEFDPDSIAREKEHRTLRVGDTMITNLGVDFKFNGDSRRYESHPKWKIISVTPIHKRRWQK